MSSKPYAPTSQTQAMVVAMAVNGVPQADNAKAVGIDAKTLRKFYRDALDYATERLCARVTHNLGRIAATGNGSADVNACRYILSCKAGWKDTSRLEVEPPFVGYGGPNGLLALLERVKGDAAKRAPRQ